MQHTTEKVRDLYMLVNHEMSVIHKCDDIMKKTNTLFYLPCLKHFPQKKARLTALFKL